jgi:CBS domain-containing protein
MTTKLVRDVMRSGVTAISADVLFVEAVRTLLHDNLESLIVSDDHSRAVGMLSKREAVEAYARSGISRGDLKTLTVADTMRSGIPDVPPDIPAITAAQIMLDQGLREIYVMHHKNAGTPNRPVGVLSLSAVLGELSNLQDGETG